MVKCPLVVGVGCDSGCHGDAKNNTVRNDDDIANTATVICIRSLLLGFVATRFDGGVVTTASASLVSLL